MKCGDCKHSHDTGTALLCWGQRFAPPVDADHWCEGWKPKSVTPQTNYDLLISKTPEELAEYLIADIEAEAIRRAGRYLTSGEINRAIADCLSWLKATVEVGK